MSNKDFTTSFEISASVQQVFDSVKNVRGWWSENIEGNMESPDSEFSYHYQDVHICKLKITEMIPGEKITWQVLDNYFNFTKDKKEWIGTHISFNIAERNGKTHLIFTHYGLQPELECYNICHDAWTHYIQDSLKNLILTGRGNATPKDTGDVKTEAPPTGPEQPLSLGIHHRLLIEKPAEIIYIALTTQERLAGWWTPDTSALSENLWRFGFGPDYYKEIRVETSKPYSLVKWNCVKGFEDWINTSISFTLQPHAKGTILVFHHEGWKSYSKEFASCSYDWALFLRSLKLLCETGKGNPYPDFNK